MIDPIPFVIVGMNVLVSLSVVVLMLLSSHPPVPESPVAQPEPSKPTE